MEGSLKKWTNMLNGYQERKFILKGSILSYYTEGNLPKGRCFLPICTIIEQPEDELEFSIDTGSAIFYLKANSKEEKAKWIHKLKIAKVESEKIFINNTNTNVTKSKSSNKRQLPKEIEVLNHNDEEFFSAEYNDESPVSITNVITSQISQIKQSPTSFVDPLYSYKRRTSLPSKIKELSYNLWDIFKGAVGKDINHFSVPVFLNEPLSMLQKLCENFQYAQLLNDAAKEANPYMRLAYCACFCIGGFTMNTKRAKKFFNPLLYETYEYIDNELNYRYFAEQVSHHPAISACFAEGDGWNFFTNNNAIVKFLLTGKMEVNNVGRCYVHFNRFNDNIVFTKPLCVVRNLIIGAIIIDMVGKFVVNNANGDHCEVDMIPSTTGEQGNLHGVIKDVYGNIKMRIEGNWLKEIKVINEDTKEEKVIWKLIPSDTEDNYYFQPYSFDLNNLTEEMKYALPRTDSRFRPDQRFMEYQDIDKAGDEKIRLEEKQRKVRKENEEKGIIPRPMYFDETYDDLTGELIYRYKGTYFDDRKKRNFSHFPDIF